MVRLFNRLVSWRGQSVRSSGADSRSGDDQALAYLRQVDPHVAQQVVDLEAAFTSDAPSQLPLPDGILTIFSPTSLGQRAADGFSGRAHRLEQWRTFLALAPLLFTWFALAGAVRHFIQESSDTTGFNERFLGQWESRFNGTAPFWVRSFSEVAYIDVMLLAVLIGVSIWHQFEVRRAQHIGTVVRRFLEAKIYAFLGSLQRMQRQQSRDDMQASLAAALESTTGKIGALSDELSTIVLMRNHELENLKAFSVTLKESTSQILDHATRMRELAETLASTQEKIGRNADNLMNVHTDIQTTLGAINTFVDTHNKNFQAIDTHIAELTSKTTSYIDTNTLQSKAMGQNMTDFAQDVSHILDRIRETMQAMPSTDEIAARWSDDLKVYFDTSQQRVQSDLDALVKRLESAIGNPLAQYAIFKDGGQIFLDIGAALQQIHRDVELIRALAAGLGHFAVDGAVGPAAARPPRS